MTSTPAFPSFRLTAETWESYINQFDCFLDVIDLADISSHRKKSFCGTTVFDTATALLAPRSIKTVPWGDLRLQRCLLAKGDLTLKIAIEESQAAELPALSAAEIQGNPVSQNSSAIHYDEASTEEGSEETNDKSPQAAQN
ncbi:hypothetical protein E2320_002239 [Naja naja]|nr:hypothetical protein E2320_002239 [Naja naja]